MAKRMQVIKVRDYGDAWVNRLAVVCSTIEKMDDVERSSTLTFLKSKFRDNWPNDSI